MKHLIILLLFFSVNAAATKPVDIQKQDQQQYQKTETVVTTTASASTQQANEQGMSLTVEGSAPDIIMVPNNNTSNCMKVYGLSFGNTSGGGGLGVPYRDKSCDFEQAADDAAANGQHTIAWYWRCHKKNLYKQFNDRAKHKEQQIQACHNTMMQMFVKEEPPPIVYEEPEPRITVNCNEKDHDDIHHRIFTACQEK